MINKFFVKGIIAVVFVNFALSAAAADFKVKIINKTGYAITELYGSNSAVNSWEEDILGNRVLRHNSSIIIDFDDGTGHCMFDFLVKFEDGDELQQGGVDVCTIGEFTFE